MKSVTQNKEISNMLDIKLTKINKDDFLFAISQIKSIPGARFNLADKIWHVPKNREIIEQLENWDFSLIDVSMKRIKNKKSKVKDTKEYLKIEIPNKVSKGLFPFQVDGVRFFQYQNGRALLADEMRLGKFQSLNAKIYTPTGYTLMKDIQVGDEIINSQGKTSIVKGVYPQGKKDLFEVVFSDNTKTTSGKEHLWKVRKEKNNQWETLTLGDIITKGIENKFYIPMVKPIEFKKNKNCFFTAFHEGHRFHVVSHPLNNHKISNAYLYNTIENRISLLQGIMYKGFFYKNTHLCYINNSSSLMASTKELISTLGGSYLETQNLNSIEDIRLPIGINPFTKDLSLLEYFQYKKDNLVEKTPYRYIIGINYIGKEECQCIETSAKDSLYITDNCIVTHNTITTIKYLQLNPQLQKVLIICPAVVKLNWKKELEKWLPKHHFKTIKVFESTDTPDWKKIKNGCFIINYDLLRKWKIKLKRCRFDIFVFDEIHFLKSAITLRTIAARKIVGNCEKIIGLTGTPIKSRPYELYTILDMLQPEQWGSEFEFGMQYCDGKYNSYTDTYNFKGSSNLKELYEKLKSIILRRKRVDVLDFIPECKEVSISVPLSDQSKYQDAVEDLVTFVAENYGRAKAHRIAGSLFISRFEILKQLTYVLKEQFIFQWLDNFLINSNEKLVIFCTHTEPVKNLIERYKGKIVRIIGADSSKKRDLAIEEFNINPDIRFFVGNIGACNMGINLSVAKNVAFLEFPWTPGELLQAKDRIQGITQKAKEVSIYYFLGKGSIDEEIFTMLVHKEKVFNNVVDGKAETTTSVLAGLLRKYQH